MGVVKARSKTFPRPKRFDIVLVVLDPTVGSEIRKTRPCVMLSPDEANTVSNTVVVAPMTTGTDAYPTRVPCTFRRKKGYVVVDQLRTIDTTRIVQILGILDSTVQKAVLASLAAFFAP